MQTSMAGSMQYQSVSGDVALNSFSKTILEESTVEVSIYLSPHRRIDKLAQIYIFENPPEIKNFLLSNKDLIQILEEAPDYIFKIFGRVPIYLELHRDPEEEWDELFIVIKTSLLPEDAIKCGKKLFDEWFCKVIRDVGNRLNFTEEPL